MNPTPNPASAAAALAEPIQRVLLLAAGQALPRSLHQAFVSLGLSATLAGPGHGPAWGHELPADVHLPTLIEALPKDLAPQLVLLIESAETAPAFQPRGIDRLEVPTIGCFCDAQLAPRSLARAPLFDHVALLHAQPLPAGLRSTFVLPPAAMPADPGPQARALLDRALSIPSRGLFLLAGRQHYARGAIGKAVECFAGAAEKSEGRSPEAFNNLGACSLALGRLDEARSFFSAALRLDPDLAAARRNLTSLPAPAGAPDPLGPLDPLGPFGQPLPSYYLGNHAALRQLIPPGARRVLEVGCAAGLFGEALKRERPGVEVVGIEMNRLVALHAARRLDAVLQGSVDQMDDFPYPPGYFDCLVFGDVLEHLIDPEQTLHRLLGHLRDGGHVVASLPNVRNYLVVADLLINGRWTYQPAGILDRTHLRFFTYREILTLLDRMGLRLEHVAANSHVGEPELLRRLAEVVESLGGDRKSFEQEGGVIQYLFRAQKPQQASAGGQA